MEYNVLVAEDEQVERDSLIQLLGEAFPGVLKVGYAAANGLFALKYLLSHPVDILFLDIRMPIMSGIDIMREVRQGNNELEIIVVSAYSDFEYARKAVEYGAADYLLKPYTRENLIQSVIKVLSRLERRERGIRTLKVLDAQRERLREMIDRDVIRTIYYSKSVPSAIELDQLIALLDLPSESWNLSVFRFPESSPPLSREEWAAFLRMYRTGRKYSIVYGAGREMIALNFIASDEIPSRQQLFHEHCRRFCLQELDRQVCYTLSGIYSGSLELLQVYNDCLSALSPLEEGSAVPEITFSGVEFARRTARALLQGDQAVLEAHMRELSLLVDDLERTQRAVLLRNYLTLLQGELFQRLPRVAAVRAEVLLAGIKVQQSHGDSQELHRCVSGMYRLMDELTRLVGGTREVVVSRIRSYIQEHLESDLGLERLAGTEGISPSHLSRIFKEVEGITVNQYVIRVRLIRGDELLRTEGGSIKEIAPRIGIRDPNYFTKLYKKYFGRAPTKTR